MNKDNNFGFIDIRNGFILPFDMKKSEENIDLFITAKDKQIIEPKMRNIITETIEPVLLMLPVDKRIKKLLDNFNEMEKKLSLGKPILGLDTKVVSNYLKQYLTIPKLNILKAEDALRGIENGYFNIIEGTLKK